MYTGVYVFPGHSVYQPLSVLKKIILPSSHHLCRSVQYAVDSIYEKITECGANDVALVIFMLLTLIR